jgi:catechol 2,3-dioxygenase-like lactoylglutathione lyase family enzyme
MVKFLHPCVSIMDPEKAVQFYEALGYHRTRTVPVALDDQGREVEATEGRTASLTNYWMGLGDQEMALELRYEHDMKIYEPTHGHISLLVDMDTTVERLKERGFGLEVPPYRPMPGSDVVIAFLRDPAGNLVELTDTPTDGG